MLLDLSHNRWTLESRAGRATLDSLPGGINGARGKYVPVGSGAASMRRTAPYDAAGQGVRLAGLVVHLANDAVWLMSGRTRMDGSTLQRRWRAG